MKKIPCGDLMVLVDDEDYEVLAGHHWHHNRPRVGKEATIAVRTKWRSNGAQYQRSMASIITDYRGVVRFLNGNRLDHRRENLWPKGPPLTEIKA